MSAPTQTAEQFKRRYLATLNKEISNQTKNYDANRVFKQTGQSTAVPVDTRSITEKTADLEGLKVLLRAELRKITDAANANSILEQLEPNEIEFAYQQFAAIEREMKSRFRTGVPAEAFTAFLERYIRQYEKTAGVEDAFDTQLEEELAPIREALNVPPRRGRVAVEGATGDYNSQFGEELPPVNWAGIKPKEGRALWSRMRAELARQYGARENNLTQGQIDRRAELKYKIDKSNMNASFEKIKQWCAENPNDWNLFRDILAGIGGRGIRGGSVAVAVVGKPRRGIVPKDLVPFGRYFVDACKLDDDIVHLKKPCGVNVPEVPTRKVSKEVCSIMKGIVGGKLPQYDDIEPLNDEDRAYLHKVVKLAKLNNQVRIPEPNKDAKKAEQERFELMRGQILAGNDNPMLIKEFKLLVLKYVKEGRIPKREANEVLYELMALGL